MQYRSFGKHHVQVSEIGFGAWAIGGSWGAQSDDDSLAALHSALDAGCNFIDTAAGYGNGRSEKLIAKVLAERAGDPVFVATKTPPAQGPWPPSPYCRADERYPEKYLRDNIEERLRNLNVERIDLLQLHTWTRAWNDDPAPLQTLRKLQKEGKLRLIGVSTPEQDQNCVVQLMRDGMIDAVQVIYNIFEQEPAAQLLPVAQETGTGIIVRVPFDESGLTGKLTNDTRFGDDDFRHNYFAGDRIARTVARVDKIKADIADTSYNLPQIALKFCLAHSAVSTVIPGMRNVAQARANCAASDLPALDDALLTKLHAHNWRRAFWYGGK